MGVSVKSILIVPRLRTEFSISSMETRASAKNSGNQRMSLIRKRRIDRLSCSISMPRRVKAWESTLPSNRTDQRGFSASRITVPGFSMDRAWWILPEFVVPPENQGFITLVVTYLWHISWQRTNRSDSLATGDCSFLRERCHLLCSHPVDGWYQTTHSNDRENGPEKRGQDEGSRGCACRKGSHMNKQGRKGARRPSRLSDDVLVGETPEKLLSPQ